ncbi:MAG: hypothetical protein FWC97_01440 [Treponema sp.]|nr:hypothetical protein [Treponema sp.]
MATCLRRNFKAIKNITLDSVVAVEAPPHRQAAGTLAAIAGQRMGIARMEN